MKYIFDSLNRRVVELSFYLFELWNPMLPQALIQTACNCSMCLSLYGIINLDLHFSITYDLRVAMQRQCLNLNGWNKRGGVDGKNTIRV